MESEVTLDQLQVFLAIVRTKSFRQASESLHRAQSAVSYAIKNLEAELGFKLFDRGHYRPQLTREGELFWEKTKGVLHKMEELQRFGQSLSLGGVEPLFRLSISALAPLEQFATLLSIVEAKFPQTQLSLTMEVLSGDKMIVNDQADLAIVAEQIPTYGGQLEVSPCHDIKMSLVIGQHHPLLKQKIDYEALKNYPQIVVQSTLDRHERNAGILFEDSHRWSVSDFASKKILIMNTNGWGHMPYHLVETEIKNKKLVEINLRGAVQKVPLHAVRKKGHQGPVAQFFWENL